MKLKYKFFLWSSLLVISGAFLGVYFLKLINYNESLQNDYQELLQSSNYIVNAEIKISSYINTMLITGSLQKDKILENLVNIQLEIDNINVLIEKERLSRAYKIIDYLEFRAEINKSFLLQKKQIMLILNKLKSNNATKSDYRELILQLNNYRLHPILNEITVLYSQNFKIIFAKNKKMIIILAVMIWLLFFAVLAMIFKLYQFNNILEDKVKDRTLKLKEQNQKVQQLMSLNSALLEHTPEGIIGLDMNGFVTFVNPSAKTLIIPNHKIIYGLHISDVIEVYLKEEKNLSLSTSDLKKYTQTGSLHMNMAIFKIKHSEVVLNVDFEITHYQYQNQNLSGYIFNFRDVSQRVKLEKELNQERAMSAHASKLASLGEMAGGIAHEINTPLGVIMLSNEEIESELNSDSMDLEYALSMTNSIRETTLKVSKIVKALRSMSHLSGGDDREFTSIDSIIDNVLTLTNEKIRLNDIKVSYNNELGSGYKIFCDPVQMSQVILNFISNSIDAIDSLKNKWIDINISEDENSTRISITDSGAGIPSENIHKIFEPFFTTKPVGKGTGLGMPISRAIMVRHGGDIKYDVESPNTKFDLFIPIRYSAIAKKAI